MSEPILEDPTWLGSRVALVGRLAGVTHREAHNLLRQQGAIIVDALELPVEWIVIGEHSSPRYEWQSRLDSPLRAAIERGETQVIDETELWQRLGMVDGEANVQRHYTPRMLAELLDVTPSRLRVWRKHGLIVAAREVHQLAYFDFQAVVAVRQLKELTAAGIPTKTIKAGLQRIRRWLPHVERPLAELSLVAAEGELMLRWGEALVDPDGQHRFDFEAFAPQLRVVSEPLVAPPAPVTVEEWLDVAADLEESGDLAAAVDACRAALAVSGPNAEVNFQLAELLYRLADHSAARERYYMAVELDENFVEARANLGCVLAELGQVELAVAAFQGALAYHADYPDVHYHLARALDELGRHAEAVGHWRTFVDLAPDSPWAEIARRRLNVAPVS
jgi:tetratricopeptide (TPR) repeat protein